MILKSSMGLTKSRCDIFSGTTQGWVCLGKLEEDEGINKDDDKREDHFGHTWVQMLHHLN
jgi:hypothetical protein